MKKIIAILSVLLILSGCTSNTYGPITYENKVELVSSDVDMSAYPTMQTTGHAFKKVSMEEANRIYSEGGTAVIFYGYPTCGFCTKAVPVINESALEMNVTVYYVDVSKNDDKQAYADFQKLAENFLTIEDGQAELYVPNVFVVKNGVILDNQLALTVDFKGGALTDKQHAELKEIYQSMFKKLGN